MQTKFQLKQKQSGQLLAKASLRGQDILWVKTAENAHTLETKKDARTWCKILSSLGPFEIIPTA